MPEINIAQCITPQMLLKRYYNHCQKIDKFMESLQKNEGKYSQTQCDEMFSFYARQVIDKNKCIEDYLAFKLIKATGKLKELGSKVFNAQLDRLEF